MPRQPLTGAGVYSIAIVMKLKQKSLSFSQLHENSPARLFRCLGIDPDDESGFEQIGSGRLATMVRIALSDPDGATNRLRIFVGGKVINGEAIGDLAPHLDLSLSEDRLARIQAAARAWQDDEARSDQTGLRS